MISVDELAKKYLSMDVKNITELKIQKLCYYSQAWYYTLYGEPLISNEFVAADRGPDCPELRNKYATSGANALASHPDYEENYTISVLEVDTFANIVFSLYGRYTGEELSDFTHSEYPWIKARALTKLDKSNIISLDDMREYYSKHTFLGTFFSKIRDSGRFTTEFRNRSYKKFVVMGTRLSIVSMDINEEKITKILIGQSSTSGKDDKLSFYSKDYEGKMYEFFKVDNNILLLTAEAKEYIMNLQSDKASLGEELEKMIENKELTYFWQYRENIEPVYAYTAPELGIMVNEKTFEDALGQVVEMLKAIKNYYDKSPRRSQDDYERRMVNKVHALYEIDKDQFYNLLGLNKKTQMRGELLPNE